MENKKEWMIAAIQKNVVLNKNIDLDKVNIAEFFEPYSICI